MEVRHEVPLATVPQISVGQVQERLGDGTRILDVRPPAEWESGHIENAHHLDYRLLPDHVGQLEFGPEEDIAVICGAGLASSTACSVLLRNGFERVSNVTGGISAWSAAGLRLIRDG